MLTSNVNTLMRVFLLTICLSTVSTAASANKPKDCGFTGGGNDPGNPNKPIGDKCAGSDKKGEQPATPLKCPTGWEIAKGPTTSTAISCKPAAPLLICSAGTTFYSQGNIIGCK